MCHLADALDHTALSGCIVNPPGSQVTVHQHLDMGQGEVDFWVCFAALERNRFDGILTSCVSAWEERADGSSRLMLAGIDEYLSSGPPRRRSSRRDDSAGVHVSMLGHLNPQMSKMSKESR